MLWQGYGPLQNDQIPPARHGYREAGDHMRGSEAHLGTLGQWPKVLVVVWQARLNGRILQGAVIGVQTLFTKINPRISHRETTVLKTF